MYIVYLASDNSDVSISKTCDNLKELVSFIVKRALFVKKDAECFSHAVVTDSNSSVLDHFKVSYSALNRFALNEQINALNKLIIDNDYAMMNSSNLARQALRNTNCYYAQQRNKLIDKLHAL